MPARNIVQGALAPTSPPTDIHLRTTVRNTCFSIDLKTMALHFPLLPHNLVVLCQNAVLHLSKTELSILGLNEAKAEC